MNVFSMLNLLFLCSNKMATIINNIFVTTQPIVCHKNNIFVFKIQNHFKNCSIL